MNVFSIDEILPPRRSGDRAWIRYRGFRCAPPPANLFQPSGLDHAGCGTATVAAQKLKRQWIGIDISPTVCRAMAKRLKDKKVCALPENEDLWTIGRGFIVRDLPWTEKKLRELPPFEFENWAVIALGGRKNNAQVGDKGI